MKLTFPVVLLASALTTQAHSGLETLKLMDGKTAYCKEAQDLYRNRLGAYTVKATDIRTHSSGIELSLEVQSFQCQGSENKFGWVPSGHLETMNYVSRTGQFGVEAIANNASLRGFRDGIYQLLVNIDLANNTQNVKLDLDYNDLLVDSEVQALENGQTIVMSIDFFMLKNVSFIGGEQPHRTNISYGAYRVRFSLEQTDDGVSAKVLK
jgi:hypothetical protein